jgi:hypothetical protein
MQQQLRYLAAVGCHTLQQLLCQRSVQVRCHAEHRVVLWQKHT